MDSLERKMFRYHILTFIVFFAFILIGKLLYIQIEEGDYYRKISENNTIKNFILEPSRGNIYSDDNSLLQRQHHVMKLDGIPKFHQNKIFKKI